MYENKCDIFPNDLEKIYIRQKTFSDVFLILSYIDFRTLNTTSPHSSISDFSGGNSGIFYGDVVAVAFIFVHVTKPC